jgi:hypothetical protein
MVAVVFVGLRLTAEAVFVVPHRMAVVESVGHLLMVAVVFANLLERRNP